MKNYHKTPFRSASLSALLAAAALLPLSAIAADTTWNGGDGNFADSTWAPAAPGATDNAIIANGSTVTINSNTTIGALDLKTGSAIEQTSGTLTVGGNFLVGTNSTKSTYELTGGSIVANGGFRIGQTNGASGEMILSGTSTVTQGTSGTLSIANSSGSGGATGTLTLTDNASWTIANTAWDAIWIGRFGSYGSDKGMGTLNVQGYASFSTAGEIGIGRETSGQGIVNLSDHGTITAKKFFRNNGTAEFNANGGTIKAGAAQSNFLENLEVNLQAGGATIDTQSFNVVNITDTTKTSKFTGVGGLTKTGSGIFTLNRDHDYTGATKVEQGTLVINGSIDSTAIEVANGATLTLTNVSNVVTDAVTLTLASGATLNLNFDGELFVNAITVNGVNLDVGTYSAADWGGLNTYAAGTGLITVVPEPSTYALLGAAGLLGLVALRRRKQS